MSLPEDMVSEVLACVKDAADLFHCARTCKRWSRLVANIRRRRPDDMSMLLSGFFTRKGKLTCLVPTPGSVFGPTTLFLGSFFRDAPRGLRLSRATPLAAHHGLLLVRLPYSDPLLHLAVCNLLAGTCIVLPPLESSWKYGDSGYAIFTTADRPSSCDEQPSWPPGYSALFKVLVICCHGYHKPCILHSFSYGEARWKMPTEIVCESTKLSICGSLKHPIAVVCHGTAHWLVWCKSTDVYRWHIIDVDAETCHGSLREIVIPIQHILPVTYEPQLSVAHDGTLLLLYLQRPGLQLKICVQQDNVKGDNDGRWLCSRVVELKLPTSIQAQEMYLTPLGEKGGTLLVKDNWMNVYAVDLKTGVMKSLASCGQINRKIVPFELYWPV
ncbi:hypothetical protein VPH35_140196 [Triticum aestivum]